MNHWALRDADGEIRMVVSSDNEEAPESVEGLAVVAAVDGVSRATHWVSGGAVVPYTQAQREAKASRPSYATTWSNTEMAWSDPRTLDDLKATKWAEVKVARDAMEFGGFTWDGSTFDSDAISQSRIQGAAQLATLAMLNSQSFEIAWTLRDNAVRTLSGADMIAAGQAMGVHIAAAHEIGRVLRSQIDAATSAEHLELIRWPT